MKMQVGDVVLINSAAGEYNTRVREIKMAPAADDKVYEWYLCDILDQVSSTGKLLPTTTYFNENMANQIVKEAA